MKFYHPLLYASFLLRLLFLISLTLTQTAFAQVPPTLLEGHAGEILAQPICADLINKSSQEILGTIYLAPQNDLSSGKTVRQNQNFDLQPAESTKICALGPFFEGRRVTLVLRTIMPLFECKTDLSQDIYLTAEPNRAGFKELAATCH